MNKKYLIHFMWIITLLMLVYAILCLYDGMSISVPLQTYGVAICVYALPMAFFKSKSAELVDLEIEYSEKMEKEIEDLILKKTGRTLTSENEGEKCYQMKNKYYRWLTNAIILRCDNRKIYLSVPKAYKKIFDKTKARKL